MTFFIIFIYNYLEKIIMLRNQKRKQIIYFEEETQSYLNTDLDLVKPKKFADIISCVDSTQLIKHQIHIDNPSLLPPSPLIEDWLYAQCVQDRVFTPSEKYAIAYLKRDLPLNKMGVIFEIFACRHIFESKDTNTIFIPDIFLPLTLLKEGDKGLEILKFGLFLFGKNLVFYHQNNLVYHCFVRDSASFSNALHYIETLYSNQPFTVYTIGECGFELSISSKSLKEVLGIFNQPIASLAFRYLAVSQELSLPLLKFKKGFSLRKSRSFNILLKAVALVLLALVYPTGELIYSIHLEHQTLKLSKKNIELLQSIASYSKETKSFDAADLETLKTQNEVIRDRLNSFYQIKTSYVPRYNLIAKLAKRVIESGTRAYFFYFVSDLEQNSSSFEIMLTSPSQANIIQFLQNLKDSPIISKDKEKIFNKAIVRSKVNVQASAQIVWVHNAF